MDKYVGKRLDGRYEIREIIGVGGMAIVYKAYDNVDDKIVAIKILKDEFTGNDEFLRRFKNESKAIAVLSHPNIVKVFDVSFGDLIQYIVMEYIDGITLKEYIEQQGPLSWNDAVRLTLQILRGLQHAHDKGVVHRDVKPHNIMVLSDGTIKVTDFGIARFARSGQKTITDKAIGSVHYISPEQARGENTDEKADIYSVGVMLYEMITGTLPFQAESAVSVAIMQLQKDPKLPRDINGSIPLGLEQITMHAMQKESSKRYKSAAEMLCDLEEFKKNPAVTFDYDYFVDDSPTKFIPLGDDNKDNTKGGKASANTEDKNHMIPILAGISVTFVIAILIVGFFLVKILILDKKSEEYTVQNYVGLTYNEVQNLPDFNKNYRIEFKYEYSSEHEQGLVYRQEPAADKKIKKGETVTLYVSRGTKIVKVDDVYGMTEAKALSILENINGFKCIIKEEDSATVDKGLVIKTDPQRNSELEIGSTITVYISSGQPEIPVQVPNVVGLTTNDAKSDLEKKGLKVGSIIDANSFNNKGTVVYLTDEEGNKVNANDTVNKGSALNIHVSRGFILAESITVDLPKDFAEKSAYISVWQDNKLLLCSDAAITFEDFEYKYEFKNLEITKKDAVLTIKVSENKLKGDGFDTGEVYSVLQIQITNNSVPEYGIKFNHDQFTYPRVTATEP